MFLQLFRLADPAQYCEQQPLWLRDGNARYFKFSQVDSFRSVLLGDTSHHKAALPPGGRFLNLPFLLTTRSLLATQTHAQLHKIPKTVLSSDCSDQMANAPLCYLKDQTSL